MNALSPGQLDMYQALSALVTIVSFPLIVLSFFAGFRQVKTQTDISRQELAFNGRMKFADTYRDISNFNHALRERFANKDKTVNERSALNYFNQYWLNSCDQFEFFYAGLVKVNNYTSWSLNAYSYLAGEKRVDYYAADGSERSYNSRDFFEHRFVGSTYVNDKAFYAFFLGLYQLKADVYPDGIIPKERRYEEIEKYIRAYIRTHRLRPLT